MSLTPKEIARVAALNMAGSQAYRTMCGMRGMMLLGFARARAIYAALPYDYQANAHLVQWTFYGGVMLPARNCTPVFVAVLADRSDCHTTVVPVRRRLSVYAMNYPMDEAGSQTIPSLVTFVHLYPYRTS